MLVSINEDLINKTIIISSFTLYIINFSNNGLAVVDHGSLLGVFPYLGIGGVYCLQY